MEGSVDRTAPSMVGAWDRHVLHTGIDPESEQAWSEAEVKNRPLWPSFASEALPTAQRSAAFKTNPWGTFQIQTMAQG